MTRDSKTRINKTRNNEIRNNKTSNNEVRDNKNRAAMYHRITVGAGIALFIIAVLMTVRLITLCFSQDVWYDELFSMEFATRSFSEMTALTAQDVHPPLYYMILRVFVLLFGALGIGEAGSVGAATTVAFQGASAPAAVYAAKLASVVPFIVLLILAITVVRKWFGIFTAGVFSFCILSMPQITAYALEIRMYGWAMLFVTAASLFAYRLMHNLMLNRGGFNFLPGLGLLVSGIAACYTHYYACLSMVCLYLLLIVWLFRTFWRASKDGFGKGRLLNARVMAVIFIDGNFTAAAFLPWLFVVANQVSDVQESYWILPLTWRSLGGVVKYLFLPAFTNGLVGKAFAVLLFAVYAGLLVWAFRQHGMQKRKTFREPKLAQPSSTEPVKNNVAQLDEKSMKEQNADQSAGKFGEQDADQSAGKFGEQNADQPDSQDVGRFNEYVSYQFAFLCFFVLVGVVAAGFIASFLIRPVFVYRYMLPAMGNFWLAFAILAGKFVPCATNFGKCRYLISALGMFLILVAGIRDFYAVRGEELYKKRLMTETVEVLESIPEDTKIVCNFNQLQALLAYTYNDCRDLYLIAGDLEPMVPKLYAKVHVIEDASVIRQWLEAGEDVLFLGSFNSREVLLQEWNEAYEIQWEDTGSYLYERYWFDVFRLY